MSLLNTSPDLIASCHARPSLRTLPGPLLRAGRPPTWRVSTGFGPTFRAEGMAHRRNACISGQRSSVITCSSSSAVSPEPVSSGGSKQSWLWALGAAALVAAAFMASSTPQFAACKEYLVNGPLGKSGFLAAFSLILLSEIGDKTFFIAAILAMKVGRWVSFMASLSALALMSVISVAIGTICSKVPDALKSSVPIGEIAGIALLVIFGIRTLKEGLSAEDGASDKSDDEMSDAEEVVSQAEQSGLRRGNPAAFLEVAGLIFVAEWGDRSMLATIALGAAQNPFGVAFGAVAGHAIATGIAVLFGAIAAKYVSEKTINIISGTLFLVFAVATAVSML